MRVSSIQTFTDPSILIISNSEFHNFFYDFNAIVNPNQFGSIITITDTIFSRISNCGSIVKNYNNYPTENGSTVPNIITEQTAYFNYMTIKLVNEMADIYHSTNLLTTPFTHSCPLSD